MLAEHLTNFKLVTPLMGTKIKSLAVDAIQESRR
jgi:hypothetical protein